MSFSGKRVLVTGAASGIGRGIAIELFKNGAQVLALDISNEVLDKLKVDIPNVESIVVNLCDWNSTKNAIRSHFPIDSLVNCAGVAKNAPFLEATESDYDITFNVNVKAVINVTQTVIENFVHRNYPGSIVNISSQCSKAGLVEHANYCASKGAIDALTRQLAVEFGKKNIRINSVNPTVVMTPLGKLVWNKQSTREAMLAKIPLNRFAEIEDVVDAVLFLLGDKSRMINGSCIPVDGGFLAG